MRHFAFFLLLFYSKRGGNVGKATKKKCFAGRSTEPMPTVWSSNFTGIVYFFVLLVSVVMSCSLHNVCTIVCVCVFVCVCVMLPFAMAHPSCRSDFTQQKQINFTHVRSRRDHANWWANSAACFFSAPPTDKTPLKLPHTHTHTRNLRSEALGGKTTVCVCVSRGTSVRKRHLSRAHGTRAVNAPSYIQTQTQTHI